jgi:hypothetical protein
MPFGIPIWQSVLIKRFRALGLQMLVALFPYSGG